MRPEIIKLEQGPKKAEEPVTMDDRERRSHYGVLKYLRKKMADKINTEYGQKNKWVVDNNGRIKAESFLEVSEGYYNPDKISADQDKVAKKKKSFEPDFELESVHEHFMDEYYPDINKDELTPEQKAEYTRKMFIFREEFSRSAIGEMAMIVLLHRHIHEHYLVVRSSEYDDYENGVDYIIVDRESGETVCGIDEVVDEVSGKRVTEKEQRFKNKAKKGGEVEYGLTFENNKIVRRKASQLPVFYLRLDGSDLARLCRNTSRNLNKINQTETEIYEKLICALAEQVENLPPDANPEVKRKAENFLRKLLKIKSDLTETGLSKAA